MKTSAEDIIADLKELETKIQAWVHRVRVLKENLAVAERVAQRLNCLKAQMHSLLELRAEYERVREAAAQFVKEEDFVDF